MEQRVCFHPYIRTFQSSSWLQLCFRMSNDKQRVFLPFQIVISFQTIKFIILKLHYISSHFFKYIYLINLKFLSYSLLYHFSSNSQLGWKTWCVKVSQLLLPIRLDWKNLDNKEKLKNS